MIQKFNRLGLEKSPYLKQHAGNPVEWYPWGEEAFRKAKAEEKPVLLSIGYSACHWCHVMAHESFENEAIAGIMNQYFINIKVDREEYPDVDHLYQTFVQMTTGRGGWPLTVFLTPDRLPFYGGTYFPATSRYGMISFPDLLNQIQDIYRNKPERIGQSTREVGAFIQEMDRGEKGDRLPKGPDSFDRLYQSLRKSFDPVHGGFGPAPKFPHTAEMDFLLQLYHYTGENRARHLALFTLRKMAQGGIYDQIGGGFHRYSTDEKWRIPHFEKMLYDNALLIPLYVDAFRLSGDEFYRKIARQTTDFVLRELRGPGGGFYSTLDADSEGEEGKYYIWEYREVQAALDPVIRDPFCKYYHVTAPGNFEGKNILYVEETLEEMTGKLKTGADRLENQIRVGIEKLLTKRQRRIPPGRDDKILADWNGMMITALWKLCQVTGERTYADAARTACEFFLEHFRKNKAGLFHFVKSDLDQIEGYLDDYAYAIQALLDGFETTQQPLYLQHAMELADVALSDFWDNTRGGFFFGPVSAPNGLIRQRQHFDGATPAGNNIMCRNLLRLRAYTGKDLYRQRCEDVFRNLQNEIENQPGSLPSLLTALLFYHFHPVEITVSTPTGHYPAGWMEKIHRLYLPNKILVQAGSGASNHIIDPGLIKSRQLPDQPAIYLCHAMTCSLPQIDPDQLRPLLNDLNLFI